MVHFYFSKYACQKLCFYLCDNHFLLKYIYKYSISFNLFNIPFNIFSLNNLIKEKNIVSYTCVTFMQNN